MVIQTKQTTLEPNSKPKCTHQDAEDNWTFEKEDDTCSTDRGTFGGVWYRCTQCDLDISDFVMDNSGDKEWESANER